MKQPEMFYFSLYTCSRLGNKKCIICEKLCEKYYSCIHLYCRHTFEVAPVFVIMEKMMVQKLCGIVGYKSGDGVFGPGEIKMHHSNCLLHCV